MQKTSYNASLITIIALIVIHVTGINTLLCQHPIIFLIAHPRSVSTGLVRAMHSRGDCAIFCQANNRAFSKMYYQQHDIEWFSDDWFHDDAPTSCEEVKKMVLKEAESRPVFIKEMSYAADTILKNTPAWLENKNVYFFFLIRNPHHAMISLYKQKKNALESRNRMNALDYQSLYKTFKLVSKKAKNQPHIIYSEDLYTNPKRILQSLCTYSNISFKQEMLTWPPLDKNFSAHKDWHIPGKNPALHSWYARALTSSGFIQPNSYDIDRKGQPTFIEIDAKNRSLYLQLFIENRKFYDLFKKVDNHYIVK